jgi:hypothetical protein
MPCKGTKLKRGLARARRDRPVVLAVSAGHQKGGPDSQASVRKWEIDGTYGTAADCDSAHRSDLNGMFGLEENSRDREKAHKALLQTHGGRCIASEDPCLAK